MKRDADLVVTAVSSSGLYTLTVRVDHGPVPGSSPAQGFAAAMRRLETEPGVSEDQLAELERGLLALADGEEGKP